MRTQGDFFYTANFQTRLGWITGDFKEYTIIYFEYLCQFFGPDSSHVWDAMGKGMKPATAILIELT